jgi:phosphoglycerate dehydrogenase-like enzyme
VRQRGGGRGRGAVALSRPRIAVLGTLSPPGVDLAAELRGGVLEGGGELVGVAEAEGIVWIDPADPDGLKRALEESPARWIQLPFAGIEPFVAAGVLDPRREWTCAKGIYGESCAEHALAFMLMAAHRMHLHARATKWMAEQDKIHDRRFHANATVAIVGTGGIGRSLAAMLEPFEVRILAANRSGRALEGAETTVTTDRLPEVVGAADFVVLAAALTDDTRGLFDADMLGHMRPHAWLCNVARGKLVDTDALVEALRSGAIGGAALDVTDPEPLPDDHPLWGFANVLITPHVANTWVMGAPALRRLVARNVRAFGTGKELEGRVDPALGY